METEFEKEPRHHPEPAPDDSTQPESAARAVINDEVAMMHDRWMRAEAETAKTFYDEYIAVLDLTAEFYLETVSRVFQEHLLPKGELVCRNRRVAPSAIRRTALFTVEGERDDICSVGQTVAAHDLCSNIFANRKRHHLQPGVGHYGVFSGRKWSTQIYPLVRNMILATN